MKTIHPTPYPDVNEILDLLLTHVKEALRDQFIGMYLYGSLSSGDFNPQTSDIDFLVVTKEVLSKEQVDALEDIHKKAWATSLKRAGELEGAYVPKKLIRRHTPMGRACPAVNEGQFYVAPLGSDWIIQRHVVREYGVVVEGPNPKTLIDVVGPEHIRSAVLGILQEWWFPMLDDPAWLRQHGSAHHAFAVITMCRVLHALEHGTITSKPKAVQWTRSQVTDRWKNLIDQASVASQHEKTDGFLEETLEFIRFVKERTAKFEAPHA